MPQISVQHVLKALSLSYKSEHVSDAQWKERQIMANYGIDENVLSEDTYGSNPEVWELPESEVTCPEGCQTYGEPVKLRISQQGNFAREDDTITVLICSQCGYEEKE